MRGTMDWQVHEIFYKSGLDKIGESKHAAKEKAWQDLKISGQKTDSHAIAEFTGIHTELLLVIYSYLLFMIWGLPMAIPLKGDSSPLIGMP